MECYVPGNRALVLVLASQPSRNVVGNAWSVAPGGPDLLRSVQAAALLLHGLRGTPLQLVDREVLCGRCDMPDVAERILDLPLRSP